MNDDKTPTPAGDFAADTRVRPDPGTTGRWHADISEAWKVFYVFGGVSMAVAIRAIGAALDTDNLTPLSANATFCSPIPAGPVEIDTRVLRRGKSVSHASAEMRAAGSDRVGLHAVATFASPGDWDHPLGTPFPDDVALPDAISAPEEPPADWPFSSINFHEQTDYLPVVGDAPWRDDWPAGEARAASWTRLKKAPLDADGRLDPIALCVPADTLGAAMGQGLGPQRPDDPFHVLLTIDMGIQWLAAAQGAWILQDCRVPHLEHGFAMSNVHLFDAQKNLVAHAYQRALLREMRTPP